MDESPAESKGKARKIAIKVAEPPAPKPIAPLVQDTAEQTRKWHRRAYISIGIGTVLIVVSSLDIYTPGARGQAAMGLLIVGGLWLVYGIYAYFRAKG